MGSLIAVRKIQPEEVDAGFHQLADVHGVGHPVSHPGIGGQPVTPGVDLAVTDDLEESA